MNLRLRTVLSFAKRNEHHISTLVFLGGFILDLLTFSLISVAVSDLLFFSYLVIAAISLLGAHAFSAGTLASDTLPKKVLAVLFPLSEQFFVGGLLSGFLIFYTKSSVLFVSWPFILLLAAVFVGNEFLRTYRSHLAFQTILFFFTLYAYLIFAIPLYRHTLSPQLFWESTVAAVLIYLPFLLVLRLAGKVRFKSAFLPITIGSTIVLVVVAGSYVTNLIPPIPLTLQEGGVYHSITHTGTTYTGEAEAPARLRLHQTVHQESGQPLYAFSSVFAPGDFSVDVVHVWQHYDPTTSAWKTEARIAFPLAGGRAAGYRGYSVKSDPEAGKWRVLVETDSGQVIGRISFTVAPVDVEPVLHTETL